MGGGRNEEVGKEKWGSREREGRNGEGEEKQGARANTALKKITKKNRK